MVLSSSLSSTSHSVYLAFFPQSDEKESILKFVMYYSEEYCICYLCIHTYIKYIDYQLHSILHVNLDLSRELNGFNVTENKSSMI